MNDVCVASALRLPLRDSSVHCVVTSPPFWGLRKYPEAASIGHEPTFDEHLSNMVAVFRGLRRVPRPDGTVWMEYGDRYASSSKWGGTSSQKNAHSMKGGCSRERREVGLADKNLMFMPHRVAMALQADGWWCRSAPIWWKPSAMPESVTDRPSADHSYVFMFTKSGKPTFWTHPELDGVRSKPKPDYEYYTDEIDGKMKRRNKWQGYDYFYDGFAERTALSTSIGGRQTGNRAPGTKYKLDDSRAAGSNTLQCPDDGAGANLRTVWRIAAEPSSLPHYAAFPSEIPRRCISLSTSEKGVCSACGAPWVRVVEKARTFESGSGKAGNLPTGKNGATMEGGGETLDVRRGPCLRAETTGWLPSCSCDAPTKPAVVLDPFVGSGTTVAAANAMGRYGIGFDIAEEYARMARRRVFSFRVDDGRVKKFEGTPDQLVLG